MITESDRARRLANAIVADIWLYNQERIDDGIRSRTLDETIGDEVAEGQALFDSRVSPELRARTRFLDAALVSRFRMRLLSGFAWEIGFERLRARLVTYPACSVCRAALGPERIAFHGIADGRWLLLLGCAGCLAVRAARGLVTLESA